MKKITIFLMLFAVLGLSACQKSYTETTSDSTTANEEAQYKMITMQEAREVFKTEGDYIILDVRTVEEYDSGHIPRAINVPLQDIGEEDIPELPDKEQTIYVYCRSGNRSKTASERLVNLGYTDVIEFGGIRDYTGDLEK